MTLSILKRSMPKSTAGTSESAGGGAAELASRRRASSLPSPMCARLPRAAEDGDADTVLAELLAGADLDVRPDGETPLLLACRHEHRSVVELLCDAGADATIADDDGWTPLHWAAALASPRLVELLLGAGSPVAAQANCGATALLFATEVDDCESVRLLLQSGARPTQASSSWLASGTNRRTRDSERELVLRTLRGRSSEETPLVSLRDMHKVDSRMRIEAQRNPDRSDPQSRPRVRWGDMQRWLPKELGWPVKRVDEALKNLLERDAFDGSSPLALALAGLPSQEHIEVGRLLAEAAGLADAWAQKEAVLNDQVRDAARRRRESSFIGNALDDDVGRLVVSMLPLASLAAIARSGKRWQSWAAPRLAQERVAVARGLVLRHLDGRSMASVAVADGRWARELAHFLSTEHSDSFNPWQQLDSLQTESLVLKSIALRMQAADLVEFFRACRRVHEAELFYDTNLDGSTLLENMQGAILSVRDRKLGWTPERLVELMDVCNGFLPGRWTSLDGLCRTRDNSGLVSSSHWLHFPFVSRPIPSQMHFTPPAMHASSSPPICRRQATSVSSAAMPPKRHRS